jgi:hypothetical protein
LSDKSLEQKSVLTDAEELIHLTSIVGQDGEQRPSRKGLLICPCGCHADPYLKRDVLKLGIRVSGNAMYMGLSDSYNMYLESLESV